MFNKLYHVAIVLQDNNVFTDQVVTDSPLNAAKYFLEMVEEADVLSVTVTYKGEYEPQENELWIADEDIFCGTGVYGQELNQYFEKEYPEEAAKIRKAYGMEYAEDVVAMEETEALLDELTQELSDEEGVFNRYYEIAICYHCDGHVHESDIGFITDSDEHAREFATIMYGANGNVDRHNGTTTWSVGFKGYVKARETETIVADEGLAGNLS